MNMNEILTFALGLFIGNFIMQQLVNSKKRDQ